MEGTEHPELIFWVLQEEGTETQVSGSEERGRGTDAGLDSYIPKEETLGVPDTL